MLQQAQVGEFQATPVSARKGKGHSGCAKALSDDLTTSLLYYNERAARSPGWFRRVCGFVIQWYQHLPVIRTELSSSGKYKKSR